MAEDLTHEQLIAEFRELAEKICHDYERLSRMREAYYERTLQHFKAMTELGKEVLRWLEERERRLAKSSPLAK
jgi:hypothetical protein